jgi:hypothetical protein
MAGNWGSKVEFLLTLLVFFLARTLPFCQAEKVSAA